jgi:hypothetical protein
MRYGILASAVALAGVVEAISLATGSVGAQGRTPVASTKTWTGQTAWGDPDLQGKWEMVETSAPMERPKELGNREVLTDQEVAARIQVLSKRPAEGDPDADVAFPAIKATAPEHEKGIRGQEYNKFWVDSGPRKIKPWKRTSLVIDPPDGRMPPFTPEAIKRIEEREAARRNRGEADTWEDRNLNERCLQASFFRFGGGGGAGELSVRQILQAPGTVAIIVSTLNSNDPIVVPLDGRPRPSDAVRTWIGVPRGRWEGTTLVIETTNVNGKQDGGPVMASRTPYQRFLGAGETLRITERFTRVDADTLEYSYTVDDPRTYVRPYTVLRPLVKLDDDLLMPENACHEGNYGIVGQLSAGRADEEYALQAARAEAAGRQSQLQEMKRRTEEWMRTQAQKR